MTSIINWESAYLDFSPYYGEEWQYYYDPILRMIPQGSKVLDIGCGAGFLSFYLVHKHNCEVVSIDVSPKAVDICMTKGLNAHCINVDTEPISGTYDYIILAASMEHMIFPRGVLEKLRGNLSESGNVIIVVPNTTDILSRLRFLKGICIQQSVGELFDKTEYGLQAAGHLHFYNQYTLGMLLNKLGYAPLEWVFATDPKVNYKSHNILAYPFVWLYHTMYGKIGGRLFSELMTVRAKKI